MELTFTQKQLINYFVDGQEDACLEIFLNAGPAALRSFLGVPPDRNDIWETLYDYFLFERNFIAIAMDRFQDFLTHVMAEQGPLRVRKIFDIEDSKYDALFSSVMNYIGISRTELFAYVSQNAQRLLNDMNRYGAASVRQELHLLDGRYDDIWRNVLDIILERFSSQKIHERKRDHVMAFFQALRSQMKSMF